MMGIVAMKKRAIDQWDRVESAGVRLDETVRNYLHAINQHSAISMLMLAQTPNIVYGAIYEQHVSRIYELAHANTAMIYMVERYALEQDKYNEIMIAIQDMENVHLDMEDDADEYLEEEDIPEVVVKKRKTKRDVLPPAEAIKACKASKLHKLKPRCEKRDNTKTKDAKQRTIRHKQIIALVPW